MRFCVFFGWKSGRERLVHQPALTNPRRPGRERPVWEAFRQPSGGGRDTRQRGPFRPQDGRRSLPDGSLTARSARNGFIFLRLLSALGIVALLPACHKTAFVPTDKDRKAILQAIKEDSVPPVVAYIEKGMSPNETDAAGKPFVVAVAEAGDTDLVYTFVSSGAAVDSADRGGQTPLMAAVIGKHGDIVTLLLARQANPNAAFTSGDRKGMTPLLLAAERGGADTLLALLAAGALPNAQDAKGRSALMLAAASGHPEAMDILLVRRPDPKLNSDLTLKDAAGKTALDYAESKRDAVMIARLLKAGVKE